MLHNILVYEIYLLCSYTNLSFRCHFAILYVYVHVGGHVNVLYDGHDQDVDF